MKNTFIIPANADEAIKSLKSFHWNFDSSAYETVWNNFPEHIKSDYEVCKYYVCHHKRNLSSDRGLEAIPELYRYDQKFHLDIIYEKPYFARFYE
jgi:hypothetical protein